MAPSVSRTESAELAMLLLANTLGLSIISENLRTASRFFIPTSKPSLEVREAYMFIQGTGLEEVLYHYGINYDADCIRNGFNYYMRHCSNGWY